MAFFVAKHDEKSLEEQSGDFINKSGIYDVIIKFASVDRSKNGSVAVNFNCEYKGTNTTLYGLRLTNNDGSENFQANLFNKLLVILGIDSVGEPTPEEHMVGKDREVKTFAVLTELSDQPVKVRIQMHYSLYQGRIIEKKEIKNFYRVDDGAVASEIEAGKNFGVQLAKDLQYAENVTYRDGLTADDIAKWIADGGRKNKAIEVPQNNEVSKDDPFAASF